MLFQTALTQMFALYHLESFNLASLSLIKATAIFYLENIALDNEGQSYFCPALTSDSTLCNIRSIYIHFCQQMHTTLTLVL